MFGIDNNGRTDVEARGNWWGTKDAKLIPAMLYDKERDKRLGRVQYLPAAQAQFPVACGR